MNRIEKMSPEEIALIYNTTPNDIQSTIKTAYNKMIDFAVHEIGYDVFDAVMFIRKELNMSYKEAIDKLNTKHLELIKIEATEKSLYDI